MTVAECIKALRSAAGFQQTELADRMGISKSMLSLVEAGKREPTIALLRAVGMALGIPTSVLFAVALAEDDRSQVTAAHKQAREQTRFLVDAAVHALQADRAHRAQQKPARRSA